VGTVSVDALLHRGATAYSQPRVLAALAAHPRLTDEWRALLPCLVPSNGHYASRPAEVDRQGIDLAEALALQPQRFGELTTAALAAIAPLHRKTATFIVVDDVCLLPRWVGQPLARLTEMCEQIDPDLVATVDQLRKLLREALIGRRMATCWTHGHYTPTSVTLDMDGAVIGIEDWGRARPAQLALIDDYLMILTASREAECTDFGSVVAVRLQAGGLPDRERNALQAKDDGPTPYPEDDAQLDERAAILLTWLHFAAGQLREHATHSKVTSWWAADVAPVLQTVAVAPGLLPADHHRTRWRRG
jgi:hypothetical protein